MSTDRDPDAVLGHGLLYVTSGYVGDRIAGLRDPARSLGRYHPGPGARHTSSPGTSRSGPYHPSPIVFGDVYFTLLDLGFFTVHDARTGKELYGRQRVAPEGIVAFTSSPWASNGKLFALSEDGDTYVIRAGPTYELTGKNSLGEMAMATPAIARGSLIVRTASRLYRIARTKPL